MEQHREVPKAMLTQASLVVDGLPLPRSNCVVSSGRAAAIDAFDSSQQSLGVYARALDSGGDAVQVTRLPRTRAATQGSDDVAFGLNTAGEELKRPVRETLLPNGGWRGNLVRGVCLSMEDECTWAVDDGAAAVHDAAQPMGLEFSASQHSESVARELQGGLLTQPLPADESQIVDNQTQCAEEDLSQVGVEDWPLQPALPHANLTQTFDDDVAAHGGAAGGHVLTPESASRAGFDAVGSLTAPVLAATPSSFGIHRDAFTPVTSLLTPAMEDSVQRLLDRERSLQCKVRNVLTSGYAAAPPSAGVAGKHDEDITVARGASDEPAVAAARRGDVAVVAPSAAPTAAAAVVAVSTGVPAGAASARANAAAAPPASASARTVVNLVEDSGSVAAAASHVVVADEVPLRPVTESGAISGAANPSDEVENKGIIDSESQFFDGTLPLPLLPCDVPHSRVVVAGVSAALHLREVLRSKKRGKRSALPEAGHTSVPSRAAPTSSGAAPAPAAAATVHDVADESDAAVGARADANCSKGTAGAAVSKAVRALDLRSAAASSDDDVRVVDGPSRVARAGGSLSPVLFDEAHDVHDAGNDDDDDDVSGCSAVRP